MSIQFQPVAGKFSDYVYALLTRFEAPHLDPRNVGDGKVTIGLGIKQSGTDHQYFYHGSISRYYTPLKLAGV